MEKQDSTNDENIDIQDEMTNKENMDISQDENTANQYENNHDNTTENINNQDETTEEKNIENEADTTNDEAKFDSLDEEFKAKMQAQVDEANDQATEAKDKLLRAYADFENFKKQLQKEKYNMIDYASEKFASDLLAPIDALQMAIVSSKGDFEPSQVVEKLQEGMELTLKAFNTAFEKHDITEVEYGKHDPELHQAVMKVDGEKFETGDIVEVLQKGYKYKDRLLREAMVSVAN